MAGSFPFARYSLRLTASVLLSGTGFSLCVCQLGKSPMELFTKSITG
jgi:hypothetical protein